MVHSARSGKTFIIVYALIVRAAKVKSRHVMLRHTFNSIKTSVWMDTLPKVLNLCFPNLPVVKNRSDYFIKLPNESEIFFAGLDDDKRVEKILGKEFSTIAFNECTQLSYSSVQIALTRLAEKNSLNKKVYYDMNPGAKNSWSYLQFEKKINPLDNEPIVDVDSYGSILMNPVDNLDNVDSEYLTMLESLSTKERDRFLHGLYSDCDDGTVYYSFSREENVSDKIVRVNSPLYCALDFNVDPSTCVIIQVVNDKIHCIDEVFLNNSDTYKMVSELKKRDYVGTAIPDSTGANRKTSGMSDFQILKEAGFTIPHVFNPFVGDRINNVNRLLEDKRILISPKCKKLINDLERVSWKDGKLDQKGASKHLTHISDALGYGAHWLFPIIKKKKPTSRIY